MNNEQPTIPYIAYESEMARHERTVKRMIVSLVLTVLLLVISNVCWLYAWCQFEYVDETTTTTTVTQDGKGQNVYGDRNSLSNGAEDNSKAQTQTDAEKEER